MEMKHGRAYKPNKGYTRNPLNGYPRNKPCPCDSDIKFKNCCLHVIPYYCTEEEANDILDMLNDHDY